MDAEHREGGGVSQHPDQQIGVAPDQGPHEQPQLIAFGLCEYREDQQQHQRTRQQQRELPHPDRWAHEQGQPQPDGVGNGGMDRRPDAGLDAVADPDLVNLGVVPDASHEPGAHGQVVEKPGAADEHEHLKAFDLPVATIQRPEALRDEEQVEDGPEQDQQGRPERGVADVICELTQGAGVGDQVDRGRAEQQKTKHKAHTAFDRTLAAAIVVPVLHHAPIE
ncbi:MAG: hypothetical protein CMJ35_06015 [Phycisphaerae bacterium]|nr:hypothetical protein [Phycisphaerae bacterium]MBM91154.1 hypothetical protein [Phycisphaerae bacterium]